MVSQGKFLMTYFIGDGDGDGGFATVPNIMPKFGTSNTAFN